LNDPRRVVITGLGAVSRFGRGVDALWRGVLAGEPAAAAPDLDPPGSALDAAAQAIEDAGLALTPQNAQHVGVVFGSTGATDAAEVALAHAAAGPVLALSGPASGAAAIAQAAELIRRGEAAVVIAGGADGRDSPMAGPSVSPGPARPFDAERTGVTLGAGAAAVVLEAEEVARARGARVQAELLGHGQSFSGGERPDAQAAARALQAALLRAEVIQGEIDWLCAAAAGDPDLDAAEARALAALWGPNVERLTVSSIHGAVGYAPAAGGALALVAAVRALGEGLVPPTAGCRALDARLPDIDLVLGEARRARLRTVLVNALSEGSNVCLIIRRRE